MSQPKEFIPSAGGGGEGPVMGESSAAKYISRYPEGLILENGATGELHREWVVEPPEERREGEDQ